MPDDRALMLKIRSPPPERVAEDEDFVTARDQERSFAPAAAAASTPAFAAIRNNPKDDVYEAIPQIIG
jgi:hypothetical protein